VQLGNLTGLLAKIQPAVAALPVTPGQDRSSKNTQFVEKVADANVRQNVQLIRERSPILREMEQKGEIKIVGAMYDVASGRVQWYE
jgi:carbonic anhydrase